MEKYYSFNELIKMIDEPFKSKCEKIYSFNKDLFKEAKGSNIKHQAWIGGYLDHLTESMNIALRLYNNLNICRKLPFSLSDSLLILFIHDLEKPWKYAKSESKRKELDKFNNYQDFILFKLKEFGFNLNEAHLNALKYIHGEGDDYNPNKNIQKPLAAFVHNCDTISARIWFDYPKNKNKW